MAQKREKKHFFYLPDLNGQVEAWRCCSRCCQSFHNSCECAANMWDGVDMNKPFSWAWGVGAFLTVAGMWVWRALWRDASLPSSGGCSSMRRDTSPQTRRWAPSSAKWKGWATPTSTALRGSGMWLTTSFHRRLVTYCSLPSVTGQWIPTQGPNPLSAH